MVLRCVLLLFFFLFLGTFIVFLCFFSTNVIHPFFFHFFKYLRLINKHGGEGLRARTACWAATTAGIASHKTASPTALSLAVEVTPSPAADLAPPFSSKYIKYIIQFIRLKSPLFPPDERQTRTAQKAARRPSLKSFFSPFLLFLS